jgi:hypothetical protein
MKTNALQTLSDDMLQRLHFAEWRLEEFLHYTEFILHHQL